MKNGKYEKGDRVKVWSLQSFFHGGFLDGEKAVVRQSQTGDNSIGSGTVVLGVVRNIEGVYKLDQHYEVYARQCEPWKDPQPVKDQGYAAAKADLEQWAKQLMENVQ